MTKVENSRAFAQKNFDNNGKGSYVLLSRLPEEQTITLGERKTIRLPAGDYAYVGSALRGFKARLSHHLRPNKQPYWHVDYLLQRTSISSIILCESLERTECTIARALSHHFGAIPGFGASDCKCRSHLFLAAADMQPEIMTILNALGLKPRVARELESGNSLLLKTPPESPTG